jgi:catalase
MSNDELYVNEHYKFDDKDKEMDEFKRHVEQVKMAQAKIAKNHSLPHPQRVFHAKTHGCLTGKLNLIEDRPESVRHGIFGPNGKASYNVLARFSNGVGFDQHDLMPDVRGIALKIFGVSDGSVGAQEQTIDFLMTNAPNPFGRDQEEFVQFMEASVEPGFLNGNLLGFLFHHAEVRKLLLKATLRIVRSLAAEQYWSGHAYLLGPDKAMKLNVRPAENAGIGMEDQGIEQEMAALESGLSAMDDGIERWLHMRGEAGNSKLNPNYLSVELLNRARQGPIKFILSVQLEKDPDSTPIENGLVEWEESVSPSIPVAELVLDRQDEFQDCDGSRFTPGHFIADHRPLGNIGRGRVFTYQASQAGRHAMPMEPAEAAIFGKEI